MSTETRVITEQQFATLISRMKPHNAAACAMMYYCGLRRGELASIERISDSRIGVIGKGSKLRQIIVPQIARPYLARAIATNPDLVYAAIKHAARAIGEGWIHPHTLRHSYATNLINAGFNIREVQELLGHSSITTTQRYTHINLDAIEERYNKLYHTQSGGGDHAS
jgi:site-specific recombinase XerD